MSKDPLTNEDKILTDAEVEQLRPHTFSTRGILVIIDGSRVKELLRAERDTKLLADTLREVRKDILMYAEDTLWTHDCCSETIVERINHALDENITEIDRTDDSIHPPTRNISPEAQAVLEAAEQWNNLPWADRPECKLPYDAPDCNCPECQLACAVEDWIEKGRP